jgi:choline kinase
MSTELYFLGAGTPASGKKPAALKRIVNNTKVIDWQLLSFDDVVQTQQPHFLGGYHIDEVIKAYPHLNFTIVANWEASNALNTFFQAPFTGGPVVITYSDTLFRKKFVNEFVALNSDVTIVIDSGWRQRYTGRAQSDIQNAELITIDGLDAEFTGLVHLSSKAVTYIQDIKESGRQKEIGNTLLDLITTLEKSELSLTYVDVYGDWAELNSPADIAHFILGSKADTLARLENVVKKSSIGKQISFTALDWQEDENFVIERVQKLFSDSRLVVRSSSLSEDNWHFSNAGRFESVLDVPCMNNSELKKAIQDVFSSYGSNPDNSEQVLVQELLQDVLMGGVVFTCALESGAPYYRFNFDDITNSTESVTSGTHSGLRTVLLSKLQSQPINNVATELSGVLEAIQELELLLDFDKLDIEFALDREGLVHIFQVRPIVVNHDSYELDFDKISNSIRRDVQRYNNLQSPMPCINGSKTLFSNMSDWNPAEIISAKPKPLAFSLYQHLITNEIWAEQRAQYGYRDVRPHPLIVAFSGQPYVDVRASFNSFIPKTLSNDSANRIVNAYVGLLTDNPHLHDKVEFDVAFTVWTPDFMEEAKARLYSYGVTSLDLDQLEQGLKDLTRAAFSRLSNDIESVYLLENRRNEIISSQVSDLDKIIALLDDCRRFGTLAFAHAARAGFVATTFLQSLVKSGVLTESRRMAFLNSFDTVAGEFKKDKERLSKGDIQKEYLVQKYGHLRSGTYEVSAPAYWEDTEKYLIPKQPKSNDEGYEKFTFTSSECSGISLIIEKLIIDISVSEFITFLTRAIQERERVKFEVSHNLSCALDICVNLGTQLSLSRDDVSFLTYSDLMQLKLNTIDRGIIKANIEVRKESYKLTQVIKYPTLIAAPEQFYCFELQQSLPNFIGLDRVIAEITTVIEGDGDHLMGKIVMIPQADPGYDWLFEYSIAGLITLYGGANSHMAVRAAEIGLPAAIGVGEKLYTSLEAAFMVELDCLGEVLRVVT